jgi:hypothetical protein
MTTITTLEPVSMISYFITHNNNNSNKDTKYWLEEQEFLLSYMILRARRLEITVLQAKEAQGNDCQF